MYNIKIDLTIEDELITEATLAAQVGKIKKYLCDEIPFSKTLDISYKRKYSQAEKDFYYEAIKDMLKIVDDNVFNKGDRDLVYSKILDLAKEKGIR